MNGRDSLLRRDNSNQMKLKKRPQKKRHPLFSERSKKALESGKNCAKSSQTTVKSDSALIWSCFLNEILALVGFEAFVKLVINLRARLRRTADLRIQRLVLDFAITC